jgi:hypothetical protein
MQACRPCPPNRPLRALLVRAAYMIRAMATRIVLITLLTIALALGSLYVFLTVRGYEIDCGGLDRDVCERTWAQIQERDRRQSPLLNLIVPITAVSVSDGTNEDPYCGTSWVHRYFIFDRWYSCI